MNNFQNKLSVITNSESPKSILSKLCQKIGQTYHLLKSENFLPYFIAIISIVTGVGIILPVKLQTQAFKENQSQFEPCQIPFELTNNRIAISAVVNNVEGYLFFENGTNGLILNEEYFDTGRKAGYLNLYGKPIKVGKMSATVSIKCTGQYFGESLFGDLGHVINEDDNRVILGVVGSSIFSEGAITFDMQNSVLIYSKAYAGGAPARFTKYDQALDMETVSEVPIVPAMWGDRKIKVALLSSASNNYIDKRFQNKNTSADQAVCWGPTSKLLISGLPIKEIAIYFYDLLDFNRRFNSVYVKGVLGQSFFKTNQVAIDYKNSKVWVKKLPKEFDIATTIR